MRYSLFLSDFDGTIARSDNTVSETVKGAIARYRKGGGIFCVCTGRPILSILQRLPDMGLDEGIAVGSQGAVIADIQSGKILFENSFGQESVLPILQALEARDIHIHLYTGDAFYCNKQDDLLPFYEKTVGMKAVIEENLSALVVKNRLKVIKLMVMDVPEKITALYAEFSEIFGKEYYVTRSSDWLVEIMPLGSTKGTALAFIAKHYGVPLERTAGIGDHLNDLPLLQVAGGKFTLQNGVQELKEVASLIVSSNDEDGICEALEYAMGEDA